MIEMLSIGILLKINNEEFNKLTVLVDRENVNDFLIDFLINYKKSDWQQTTSLLWKKYKKIVDVIETSKENKEKGLELLKKYLKSWYKSIEIKTHESKWNIHKGYWSWESGAIAKIIGLEDNNLKDESYYPYDMVHFED